MWFYLFQSTFLFVGGLKGGVKDDPSESFSVVNFSLIKIADIQEVTTPVCRNLLK